MRRKVDVERPGFTVVRNPDRQAEIAENYSELRRGVTAARIDGKTYQRATDHISSAPFKERRHITPMLIVDDEQLRAHDMTQRAIRLSKVDRLVSEHMVAPQDFSTVSSTGLARILDQHQEDLKRLKATRRR